MSAAGRSSMQLSAASADLAALADPPNRQIDAAVMDYLLIEMVHTLRASSAVATNRVKRMEKEMVDAGLLAAVTTPAASSKKEPSARDSTSSLNSKTAKAPVDEEEEAVRTRLEAIGVHVGANYTERLSSDRPLFTETLDVIKFICKDVWAACWEKQVDNLRTNHRGVYVLQDNVFKSISRISSPESRADAIRRARPYVAVSTGIIRGALSRLGYHATVTAEITSLPQCTFQIKLPKGS